MLFRNNRSKPQPSFIHNYPYTSVCTFTTRRCQPNDKQNTIIISTNTRRLVSLVITRSKNWTRLFSHFLESRSVGISVCVRVCEIYTSKLHEKLCSCLFQYSFYYHYTNIQIFATTTLTSKSHQYIRVPFTHTHSNHSEYYYAHIRWILIDRKWKIVWRRQHLFRKCSKLLLVLNCLTKY